MTRARRRIRLSGLVQGVGFRPFVARLARDLDLGGWVRNSVAGVTIEVEGEPPALARFDDRLRTGLPPHAAIRTFASESIAAEGSPEFEIRTSALSEGPSAGLVLPDLATCDACLREVLDPADRRHRYPFTNCTHCGPRFSILDALPYDRARTSMADFPMCDACRTEYEDESDRRYHAQPNACPDCGPRVAWATPDGRTRALGDEALRAAATGIRNGEIWAVKGLGGFHLVCRADEEEGVRRLRKRKHRPAKPLAVMVASLDEAASLARLDDPAPALLKSPAAPICILPTQPDASLAPSIAPRNPTVGIFLAYTPLHHLLCRDVGRPIVATSGNLSEEPICHENEEALDRLSGLADAFLLHDRPIRNRQDDSVLRPTARGPIPIRRARGYAPLPTAGPVRDEGTVACGGHQKVTFALTAAGRIHLSPHIGDLTDGRTEEAYLSTRTRMLRLFRARARRFLHDAHPDYRTTHLARETGAPHRPIQHHLAHVCACAGERELSPPVLGVAWDGTGYGPDETIWGGEWLQLSEKTWERVATFRPFPLPGGEAAVREPRRTAVGLLWELFGPTTFEKPDRPPLACFEPGDRDLLRQMLERGLNCPRARSVGRLYDAVAACLGLHPKTDFEGQAAIRLEHLAAASDTPAPLDPLQIGEGRPMVVDPAPTLQSLLIARDEGAPATDLAAGFQKALIDVIGRIADRLGERTIVLTGGCFQNAGLTEGAISALMERGFEPHVHRELPPNDGGLAYGQLVADAWYGAATRTATRRGR